MSEYRFLNPYNFVRFMGKARPENDVLGNCPPPPHDRYTGLTGRISCKATAVTPLFVSDSHDVKGKEENAHKTYRFFKVDGHPAIPASSLRGMVRSVFEAVTNSCLAVFDDRILSYRLPLGESLWLVPARVERKGEDWRLQLLTGDTRKGELAAAWCASYWPVTASKTLKGVRPKGWDPNRPLPYRQARFIARTRDRDPNPEGIKHGEKCWALLEQFQHPHPRIRFWDVVEVQRERSDLPKYPRERQRVEHGYLCITNQNIEPKHSERFFFRTEESDEPEFIELPKIVRESYEEIVREYQERHDADVRDRKRHGVDPGKRLNDETPGLSRFVYTAEERHLKGGELVYAWLDGPKASPRVRFIVPVAVPRVRYRRRMGELLPLPHSQHVRCREYDRLCPACRVFGWVKDKAESEDDRETLTAYASRVRFSYGEYTEGSAKVLDATTLAVLSSPKPTTSAFYLLKNDKPNATVDYDTYGARLRGRKLYHHHGKQLSGQEYKRPLNTKDKHNRTIEDALGAGAVFTFKVDFENLTLKELGALLYTLELEDGLFHRIGYGKPLGFGSIQVAVESLQVLDWESRLSSVDLTAGWENELTGAKRAEYKEEFHRAMREHYGTDYENHVLVDLRGLLGEPPEIPIHYPRPGEQPDPEGRNYEWFVGNKARIQDRQREEPKLPAPCALPLAADESEENSLPLIDRSGRWPARGR